MEQSRNLAANGHSSYSQTESRPAGLIRFWHLSLCRTLYLEWKKQAPLPRANQGKANRRWGALKMAESAAERLQDRPLTRSNRGERASRARPRSSSSRAEREAQV